MSDERKFVRVFYTDMIRDYPAVWADDRQLATWLRMLATADPMWPTPPEVARSVRSGPLGKLVESSLVESLPDGRYRIKGLEGERTKRSDAARNAATVRWQNERNAEAVPTRPDHTKTRPDQPRESLPGFDGRADLEAFLLVTQRAPTAKQRTYLDRLLAYHDLSGPQWAADLILANPDDPIGAVMAADKVWRDERIAAAKEQEKKPAEPRRKAGMPDSTRELLEHWKNNPSGSESAA